MATEPTLHMLLSADDDTFSRYVDDARYGEVSPEYFERAAIAVVLRASDDEIRSGRDLLPYRQAFVPTARPPFDLEVAELAVVRRGNLATQNVRSIAGVKVPESEDTLNIEGRQTAQGQVPSGDQESVEQKVDDKKNRITRQGVIDLNALNIPEGLERLIYAVQHAPLDIATVQRIRDAADIRLREGGALEPAQVTRGAPTDETPEKAVIKSIDDDSTAVTAKSPRVARLQVLEAEKHVAKSREQIQPTVQRLFRELGIIEIRSDEASNIEANGEIAEKLTNLLNDNGLMVQRHGDDVAGIIRWSVGGKAGKTWRFEISGCGADGRQTTRTFNNDFSRLDAIAVNQFRVG